MGPDKSLLLARRAMSVDSKEARQSLVSDNEEAKRILAKFWNKRKICGQCQHYSQLGGVGSGLAGVCRELVSTEYLVPEEPGCPAFDKTSTKKDL